ncbi:hypothetical protein PTKIN_Ptkin01aG0134500 [Pterospermum kingtungense]
MYKREEIPIPSVNPQGQLHISGATAATENQICPILNPPTGKLPISDIDLHRGQKVLQEKVLDSGLQNNKAFERDQSLQGFAAFKLMKGPIINVEAPKASEPVSATFTSTSPATEIVNLKPQIQHQAVSSDLKPRDLIPPSPASMTNLPIMIFGAEPLPSEPKPAAEESVVPTMVVPVASSSSSAANTNIVESNAKDAI